MKLALLLSSSYQRDRAKGLKILRKFLLREQEFTEKEIFQLWHAIFQCYWVTDQETDQDKIGEFCGTFLLDSPSEDRSFLFLKGFWFTMCKRWDEIDCRMDKYMHFVRMMYNYSLKFLQSKEWEVEKIQRWGKLLEEFPLTGLSNRRGICNHVVDLFLEELNKVVKEKEEINFEIFSHLLEPFFKLQYIHDDKFYAKRSKVKIFDELIHHAKNTAVDEDNLEIFKKFKPLSAHLFEIAKSKDTGDVQRRRVYKIKKEIDQFIIEFESKKIVVEEENKVGTKRKAEAEIKEDAKKAKFKE